LETESTENSFRKDYRTLRQVGAGSSLAGMTMSKITDEKEKILVTACEIFFSRGFYKIPVDEIAASLKMSKKTIYKHFPTKEELVREVAHSFIQKHSSNIASIISKKYNAVEKLYHIFKYLGREILNVNDKWFSDFHEHYPEIWEEIEKFRFKFMTANISRIIEQGKKEGCVVDMPSIIIINIFISSVRGIINPEFIMLNKIPVVLALESTLGVLMNGILTPKGKIILKKLNTEKV
jgi:AcrR family transcriptional regulator